MTTAKLSALLGLAMLTGLSAAQAQERLPPGVRMPARPGQPSAAEKIVPVDALKTGQCAALGPGFAPIGAGGTCVKIGGQVRLDAGGYSGRRSALPPVSRPRSYGSAAKATVGLDARTPTEAGTIRTVLRAKMNHQTGSFAGESAKP